MSTSRRYSTQSVPGLPDGVLALMQVTGTQAYWSPEAFNRGARVKHSDRWHITFSGVYYSKGYVWLPSDSTFEDWRLAIADLLDRKPQLELAARREYT